MNAAVHSVESVPSGHHTAMCARVRFDDRAMSAASLHCSYPTTIRVTTAAIKATTTQWTAKKPPT